MSTTIVIGTGTQYSTDEASGGEKLDRLLEENALTGEHVWTAVVMFVLGTSFSTASPLDLDERNLAAGPAIGCYRCEQPFSPQVAAQPCPGEPGESA